MSISILLQKLPPLLLMGLVGMFLFPGCGEKKESEMPKELNLKDLPQTALPEKPLRLPAQSHPDANLHNEEGISHYKEGHYKVSLKHFRKAEQADSKIGEIHFNIALALKNMGDHGGASEHLKKAQQYAGGNIKILESSLIEEFLNPEGITFDPKR